MNAALEWGSLWHLIQDNILQSTNLKLADVYKGLDAKLTQLTRNPTDANNKKHVFFQRVTNLTNIDFTDEEAFLLNKGMKYNLSHKRKNWIQNLSIEAEYAITLVPQEEKEYMPLRVAKQIDKIYARLPSHRSNTPKQSRKLRIVKSIKEKLHANNAVLTKADKGSSIVIMYNTDYEDKMSNFILDNNALTTTNNITVTFQKELKHTLKRCKIIINPETSWKFTNLNPKTPFT